MPATRIWVVDRVEPPMAVVVADDDERQVDVPLARLPAGVRAGAVLRVPEADDVPDWEAASVDEDCGGHACRRRRPHLTGYAAGIRGRYRAVAPAVAFLRPSPPSYTLHLKVHCTSMQSSGGSG